MRKRLAFLAVLLLAFPAFAQTAVTATIASGTSTSAVVNLNSYLHIGQPHPVQILMPAAWTTASLIFLVSNDGGNTFTELYDGNGNEYVVNAAAGELILLDPAVFGYIGVFEIQSVNYASPPSVPVNQGAARTLTVIAQPIN
jgi:hypothetical protein